MHLTKKTYEIYENDFAFSSTARGQAHPQFAGRRPHLLTKEPIEKYTENTKILIIVTELTIGQLRWTLKMESQKRETFAIFLRAREEKKMYLKFIEKLRSQ